MVSNTEWTEVPNDSKCDITQQFDWENLPSQACSFKHICSDGICGGQQYSCPPIQSCEAPLDEFPHVCDLSGPASETGGCQRRKLSLGVVCAPQVHGCIPEAVCTGIVGTCPPQIELPGIIYEDQTKRLRLRLLDGSDADPLYAVTPSLTEVSVIYDSFRVQCGELQLRLAVIPNGECSISRVTEELGGWGDGFSPPPRGFYSVVTPEVAVHFIGESTPATQLAQADRDTRGVFGDRTGRMVRLDSGAGDFTSALVAEFRAAGVPSPFLDLEVKRVHGLQLAAAILQDAWNNTIVFSLPSVQVSNQWTTVSGRGEQTTSDFDWASVVGLLLEYDGPPDNIAPGVTLFVVRDVRLRTRAQAPPCNLVHLTNSAGPETTLELGEVVRANVYAANLSAHVDLSAMYDVDQNAFKDDTYLSVEVLSPAAGHVPTELAVLGADGEGFVAGHLQASVPRSVVPGGDNAGDSVSDWVTLIVPLRRGLLTGAVEDTTFQRTSRIMLRFAAGTTDRAGGAPLVRNLYVGQGSYCAHAAESARNGALEMFAGSSTVPDLILQPQAGSTEMWLSTGTISDVGVDTQDLDLSSLFDTNCQCFADAVMEIDVTLPNQWMRLSRVDFVHAASETGLSLELPDPVVQPRVASASPSGTVRGTVFVDLDSDAATVVGPPSAWQNVNVMRFWRNLAADVDPSVLGDVVLHSIRVRKTGVPCVTSTALTPVGFSSPNGAVAAGGEEVVLGVGDQSSGMLGRVAEHMDEETSEVVSRSAGAWLDGGAEGDSADAYTAVTLVSGATPNRVVAVAVGSYESRTAPRFAGVEVAPAPMSAAAGVVAGRDARTGRGMWALGLGGGAIPSAVATVVQSSSNSVFALVVGAVDGTTAGVAADVAGVTSVTPAAGGVDGFALLVGAARGTATEVGVMGTSGSDSWTCVASNFDAGADASLVAVGGTTDGAPAALNLTAADAPSAAASAAIVAVYEDVDALVAGGAPRFARAFGHATDAVTASVQSVVFQSAASGEATVVVLGAYSGGALRLSASVELTAPAGGATAGFVAALAAVDGELLWGRALEPNAAGDAPAIVAAPHSVARAGADVVVCATSAGAAPVALVARLSSSTGEAVWRTSISAASCNAVVTSDDGDVLVAGTVAPGDVVVAVDGVDAGTRVHRLADSGHTLGLMARLAQDSGAWRHSEAVAGGAGDASIAAVIVSSSNANTAVAVGAAVGGARFGVPVTALYSAAADAATPTASDALFGAFSPAAVVSTGAPVVVYRDGGAAEESAAAVVATAGSFVLTGEVRAHAATPSDVPIVAGLPIANAEAAQVEAGATLAVLQFVSRRASTPFASVVLGSAWGVSDGSHWAGAVEAASDLVLAAGHVRTSSPFLTPPLPNPDHVLVLDHGNTQEALVTMFSTQGVLVWALASEAAGGTGGNDEVVDIAFDGRSSLAAVAMNTDANDLYFCGHDYGAEPHGAACTTARVSLMQLGSDLTTGPESVSTITFGGDGVSSTVASVSLGAGGVLAVSGTFRRGASRYAPAFAAGVLVVPGHISTSPMDTNDPESYASGSGVTLQSPHDGSTVGWTALYSVATGELVWAALVATDVDGADVPAVNLASVSVSTADVLLCGNLESSGDTMAAGSLVVSSSPPVAGAIASYNADSAILSASASSTASASVYSTTVGPANAFVTSLSRMQGRSHWMHFATAPTDPSDEATCAAITAGADGSFTSLGQVSGTASQQGGAWVMQGRVQDGEMLYETRLSSAPRRGEQAADGGVVIRGAVVDQLTGMVVVTGSAKAGILSASTTTAALGTADTVPLAGSASRGGPTSGDSWDAVLIGLPVPSLSPTNRLRGPDALPETFSVAVRSPTADGAVSTTIIGDVNAAPQFGAGQGFATGVSVGATRTLSVGYFRGQLVFQHADGLTSTETGAGSFAAGDQYDAIATMYSHTAETEYLGAVRILGADGAANDDRFRAASATPNGLFHAVVGHVTTPLPEQLISVGGVQTTTAGNGGRDGLLAVLSDYDASVTLLTMPGATAGGDDALLAVDTNNAQVLTGGSAAGVVPTYGGPVVYSGDIGDRTIATVYLTTISDATELWGRGYGTIADGGFAQTTAVAFSADASRVVFAGNFRGGRLQLDGFTLDTMRSDDDSEPTAFVAMLQSSGGNIIWARAGRTGPNAGAGTFSTVRGITASAQTVLLSGEFRSLGPAYLMFDEEPEATGAPQASTPVRGVPAANAIPDEAPPAHGFVAALRLTDGVTVDMHVPECPNGCRAGGVAIADGRAYAAFTYQGHATFGSFSNADPASPAMHRGALVVFSTNTRSVDNVQWVGTPGSAHVDIASVAVGARGAVLGVAGWRSGQVGLPGKSGAGALCGVIGCEVPALVDAPFGALAEFLPLFASFSPAARPAPAPIVASTAVPVPLTTGALAAGSAAPLRDGVGVVTALGAHIALTGITTAAGNVTGDDGSLLAATRGNGTDGVVIATDRRSGAQLWAWPVAGEASNMADDGIHAAATSDNGGIVCVGGVVNDRGQGGLDSLFGVEGVVASGGGGQRDGLVACFHGSPAAVAAGGAGDLSTPLWVAAVGSASDQSVTAMAAGNGVLWVAISTTGALSFAGSDVSHPAEAAASWCAILAFDIHDGTELVVGTAFGGANAADSCEVTSMAVSPNGESLHIAGTVSGLSVVIGGSTIIPTSAIKATPFYAAFRNGNAVSGALTPVHASAARYSPGLYAPSSTTFGSVCGIAASWGGADGGPNTRDRVYVTGMFSSADLLWGTASDVTKAAELPGSGDPSSAFVAAFDADTGDVEWVRAVRAVTRDGMLSCGGIAVAADGRLTIALVAQSAVPYSVTQPASKPATFVGAVNAQTYGVVAQLHAHGGALAHAYTIADAAPAVGGSSQVGRVHLAVAPIRGGASVADDLVIAGTARGNVAANIDFVAGRTVSSPDVDGGFLVFSVPVGRAARLPSSLGRVTSFDASAVANLYDTDYVVQFEVWRSSGVGVIAGGSWRSADGAGPGIEFVVTSEGQEQQAASPRHWLTVEAPATVARVAAGRHVFGSFGGEVLLRDLRTLVLRTTTDAIDESARWRVRNVKLVPRAAECVPCGQVGVHRGAVSLARPESPASSAGGLVELQPADASDPLVVLPVDLTTLVDPSCACLAGAEVVWEERMPFGWTPDTPVPASHVHVASVALTGAGVGIGVATSTITYSEEVAESDHGYVWLTASAHFRLHDHVRAADMDWRLVSGLRFLASVPPAADGEATVPAAELRIRRVDVQRRCGQADVLLHPRPVEVNTTVEIIRSGLPLVRGQSYRIITYETNMWGDANVPTCSRDFVPDDTPPSVEEATLLDIEPIIGAAHEDQAFSRHKTLRVGWSGRFNEPDSAPENLLLFRIVNITAGSPDGISVEDIVTEEKLLAVTSTGYINTITALPLEDGEKYFVHLGVCNRAKLCNTIISEHGVVHDSSPPESPKLYVTDTPDTTVNTSVVHFPDVKVFHQRSDQAIHASWAAFEDPHTWVDDLRVGLGTAEFGTDVHEFTPIPNTTTSYTFGPKDGESALLHGQVYYVVWYASNPASAATFYRTAPLYIDDTPPQVHFLADIFPIDLPGAESYYEVDENVGDTDLTDGTIVRAKFHCDDPESIAGSTRGNITYRWRVCNTAECDDVIYHDWMDVGTTPRGTAPATILDAAREDGSLDWVFTQMECTNPVGLSTRGSTNGMRFDPTPPNNATAFVVEFDPREGASRDLDTGDVDFLPTETLIVSWAGFVTALGRPPVMDYQVGIGSMPGLDDVQAFASVGLSTEFETDADVTPFAHGETYYATVKAVTTAGASSIVRSDGVTFDRWNPELTMADVAADHLALDDPARCASHLSCMSISGPGEDIDYVPTAVALSFEVLTRRSIAPVTLLEFGASTCDPSTLLDLNLLPMQTASNPLQERFNADGVSMFHGQRYCAMVFDTAITGLVGYNSSDGVLVDITPPVPVVLHEGTSVDLDDDAVGNTDAVSLTVTCSDPESGVHHVEVRVLHVDFSSGAVLGVQRNWSAIPDSFAPPAVEPAVFRVTLTGLDTTHGEWYVSSARCVNGAGAYSDIDSDGFIVDTTPPDVGSVDIRHAVHNVYARFQTDTGTLSASWVGFDDSLSKVTAYAWSIGTTPHGTDVLDVTNVGSATAASAGPGLELIDGTTYYVTVYSTNAAGLVSSTASGGVTVDSTAPLAPEEVLISLDAEHAKTGWLGSTTDMHLMWDASVEPDSNVTYRWALGTVPNGQQVVPWVYTGHQTSDHASGLALIPGLSYYVTVEVTNDAGLQAVAYSTRIRVDPYRPTAGTVADGLSVALPKRAQSVDDALDCAWSGFADAQSTIESYAVGWGTTKGTADAVSFEAVDAAQTSYTATGLSLVPGTVYFCTVMAYDSAGNMIAQSSDGVVVDTTPAIAGSVLDIALDGIGGSGAADIDGQVDAYRIRASWPGWRDAETGLTRVEWALGTSAGDTDISGHWMHVRRHTTTATFTSSSAIPVATTVYASVRVWNGVGLITEASSDGVVILPPADDFASLPITAEVVHVPANPATHQPGASWCSCGDPDGLVAASGAVFDPSTGACSCGPGLYLDAASGLCVTCPAGTCKRGFGNAMGHCTAAQCQSDTPDAATPQPPTPASALDTCGPAPSAEEAAMGVVSRITRPSDSACVCPAGSRADRSTGLCVTCPAGTANWWHADVAECGVCWAAASPDAVLHVTWDTDGLVDTGVTPDEIVVSAGTSAAALRWVRSYAADATSAQFHTREAATGTASGSGSPPLRQGSVVYVRVRALVGGIVVGDARTVTRLIDFSPPVPGVVVDGPSLGLADAYVVASGSTLFAGWHSFSDEEGRRDGAGIGAGAGGGDGVTEYHVAFGSGGPYSDDLSAGWMEVGTDNTTTLALGSGNAVADGTVVTVSVRAFNHAGAWSAAASDGAVVQSAVPAGVVVVVAAEDAGGLGGEASYRHNAAQVSTTTIGVAWQFASTSPAVPLTYTWYLQDEASGEVLTNKTAVGQATWGANYNLATPLEPGRTYVAVVVAQNAAGVTRTVTSPPVLIDVTPPITTGVNITRPSTSASALEYASTTVMYQAETDVLAVRWECHDAQADVVNVSVAVGTATGGDQALAAVTVPHMADVTEFGGLAMVHGHCYRAQVACTTEAELTGAYVPSSAVCIDATAPHAAIVVAHPVLMLTEADAEAAGNSTATTTNATVLSILSQSSGSAAATVLAADEHLDAAAPHVAAVVQSMAVGGVTGVAANLGLVVSATVAAADTESSISHVEVMWSLSPGGYATGSDDGVVGWTPTSLDDIDLFGNGVAAPGITFADLAEAVAAKVGNGGAGTRVYTHWRVFNGAGASSVATADQALVLDATPPLPIATAGVSASSGIGLNPRQFTTAGVHVSWAYNDSETGVAGYTWGVTRASDGAVVVAPAWVGGATAATASGLVLSHGETYDVAVTACNGALLCATYTESFTVDTTSPTRGTLFLGSYDDAVVSTLCGPTNATNEDAPCLLGEPSMLPAGSVAAAGNVSWGGFYDAHSAITSYTLALGTSPLGAQVGTSVTVPGDVRSLPLSRLAVADPVAVEAALFDGLDLWVSITATNAAGLSASVVAPLLAVDRTSPTVGPVLFTGSISTPRLLPADGSTDATTGGVGIARVVQADSTSASVAWMPFTDTGTVVSGDIAYTASILDTRDLSVVAAPMQPGAPAATGELTVAWSDLNLASGVLYVAVVTAVDGAGNSVTARSQQLLVVDATPPRQAGGRNALGYGLVRDGSMAGEDSDCQPRAGVTPANPGDVLTIDARGGVGHVVSSGEDIVALAMDATSSFSVLPFVCEPFHDEESGVELLRVAVGSSMGETSIMEWVDVSAHTVAGQVVLPKLPTGSVAFVGVQAVNAAGLTAEAWSDGVRMLCQPGTAGCDFDGNFVCLAPWSASAATE